MPTCGWDELECVDQPHVGHFEAGQAGRDLADHCHSLVGQPDDSRDHNGQHDNEEWCWELGKQPSEEQQDSQAGHPDRESGPVDLVDLPDDLEQLARRTLSTDVQAEQLAELTDDQHGCNTVDVADEHGP